jgi:hypothetical protein
VSAEGARTAVRMASASLDEIRTVFRVKVM